MAGISKEVPLNNNKKIAAEAVFFSPPNIVYFSRLFCGTKAGWGLLNHAILIGTL